MDHPNYARIQALLAVDITDVGERVERRALEKYLDEALGAIDTFSSRLPEAMDSEAAGAAVEWVTRARERVVAHQQLLSQMAESRIAAFSALSEARESGRSLSEELVSPFERVSIFALGSVVVPGLGAVAGSAYVAAVASQRNRAREADAGAILEEMNGKLYSLRPELGHDETADPSGGGQGGTGDGGSGGLGSSWSGAGGAGGAGGESSGWSPTPSMSAGSAGASWGGSVIGPTAASSLGVGSGTTSPVFVEDSGGWRVPVEGPGSVTSPISDPGDLEDVDLIHTPVRLTPDGPNEGYVPPTVSDIDDARWRPGYHTSDVSGVTGGPRAGMMVGGVLGGGATALALGRSGVPGLSGSLMGPAGSAGGRVPGGGVIGQTGVGGAGTSSSASAATAGRGAGASDGGRPLMGAPGMGSAGSEDERKKARRGYDVFRLDADEAQGPVDTSGQGAGSVEDLGPAVSAAEEDQW